MPVSLAAVRTRLAGTLASPGRELALVTAIVVACLGLQTVRVDRFTEDHPAFSEPGWDHHAYRAMAEGNPLDLHVAPFGWRPLVPAAAKALPVPLEEAFFALTFLGLTAAAVATYVAVRSRVGRQAGAVAAAVVLSLAWAVKFPLQDFWLPDALAFGALGLAWVAITRGSDRALLAILLIGVLAKEVVLFAVVLRYTLRARRLVDWRAAGQTALVALPAVAVLLALRVFVDARNGDPTYIAGLSPTLQTFASYIPGYNYLDLLRDIGADRLQDHRKDTLLAYTSGTWGVPVLALAVLGAAARPVLALRLLPYLALVYSQLLFALNIERLLVAGFPAVAWLAAEGAAVLAGAFRVPVLTLLPIPAALFVLRLRDPANVFTGFEIETLVLLAGMAVPVAWATVNRRIGRPA